MPTKSLLARTLLGPSARRLYSQRPLGVTSSIIHASHAKKEGTATDPLTRGNDLARVEAILLLSHEPMSMKQIASVAGLSEVSNAINLINQLRDFYQKGNSSFQIQEIAGGVQLMSLPIYHSWLVRLRRSGKELNLTPAIMETLAVIAYKQPVTRAEVEQIRGVASVDLIRQLMERGLIRTAGRHDSLGRPQLYVTSKLFLQTLGLNSLKDLPEVDSLRSSFSSRG